jgi:hypothetical protein
MLTAEPPPFGHGPRRTRSVSDIAGSMGTLSDLASPSQAMAAPAAESQSPTMRLTPTPPLPTPSPTLASLLDFETAPSDELSHAVDYLSHPFDLDDIFPARKALDKYCAVDGSGIVRVRLDNVLWRAWGIRAWDLGRADPRELNWWVSIGFLRLIWLLLTSSFSRSPGTRTLTPDSCTARFRNRVRRASTRRWLGLHLQI